MTPVRTFWLEPSPFVRRELRVFRKTWNMPDDVQARTCRCDESTPLGDFDLPVDEPTLTREVDPQPGHPQACTACGRRFDPVNDEYQHFEERLYRRSDTSELVTLRGAPPGASWDATWYHDLPHLCGPDGLAVIVRCPDGHDWHLDGRCSNCTKPDDWEHRCWVRHGDPRKAELTVDKNGNTCGAGAGSIQTPKWHGFLRAGILAE